MVYFTHCPSPLGPLLLLSDGNALTGLYLPSQKSPTAKARQMDDLEIFTQVRRWLDSYFQGCPEEVTFPLSPVGTDFRQQVWAHLLTVPYGSTCTYGEIAKAIRPSMSAQAVGQAVGANPISIIIPCHRCVGAGHKLTGYAGGLEAKRWLLHHESK